MLLLDLTLITFEMDSGIQSMAPPLSLGLLWCWQWIVADRLLQF